MTTPERIRRRQYILASLVMVMGATLVLQALYFNHQDAQQRSCLARVVDDLTDALDARGDLQQRESQANQKVWGAWITAARALQDNPGKPLTPRESERLRKQLVGDLLDYQSTISGIQRDRVEHPIPPYPEGTCQ